MRLLAKPEAMSYSVMSHFSIFQEDRQMNESVLHGNIRHLCRQLQSTLSTARWTNLEGASQVISEGPVIEGVLKKNTGIIVIDDHPFRYFVVEKLLRESVLPALNVPTTNLALQDWVVNDLHSQQKVKFADEVVPTMDGEINTAPENRQTPEVYETTTQRVTKDVGVISDDEPAINSRPLPEGKDPLIEKIKVARGIRPFNWKKWGSIAGGIVLLVLIFVFVRWLMHNHPLHTPTLHPSMTWLFAIVLLGALAFLAWVIIRGAGIILTTLAVGAIVLIGSLWLYNNPIAVTKTEAKATTLTNTPAPNISSPTETSDSAKIATVEGKQRADRADIDTLKTDVRSLDTRATNVEESAATLAAAKPEPKAAKARVRATTSHSAWVDKDGYPLTARRYTKHQLVPQNIVR